MPVETEEEPPLKFYPRPQKTVELSVPMDALASLDEVAKHRDMSREALLRSYIGSGLRQDLAQMFGGKVMEATAQALSRHHVTKEDADEIMSEIRRAVRPSFVK